MESDLRSGCAVVLGAGGGIGRVLVEQFRAVGIETVPLYHEAAPPPTEKYRGIGRADVRSPEVMALRFEEAAAAAGPIGMLVNCAATNTNAAVDNLTPEVLQRIFEVNVTGTVNACQQVLRHMPAEGGTIVNMSSVTVRGVRGAAAYAASKGAVEAFTRCFSKEVRAGVTVNALRLGYFSAGLIRDVPPAALKKIIEASTAKRLGDPAEVAAMCITLWKSPFITGSIIDMDGGLTS
jgi:3-oxoacyl-[acyl-carrier protein] reductase